jgi:imidazolonepropionase-like amidohydrolase
MTIKKQIVRIAVYCGTDILVRVCNPSRDCATLPAMRLALVVIGMALSLRAETGSFVIHLILHAIGEERYEIAASSSGLTLNTTFQYNDRGTIKRNVTASLRTQDDYTPVSVEINGQGDPYVAHVDPGMSQPMAFPITGPSPFAIQMMMLRYWTTHGKPSSLAMLRAGSHAEPIRIESAGHDSITVAGHTVALERYTIANLMFGREILWMDAQGNLAAAMTFAGGLPMEAVRAEYEPALPQLYQRGVDQEMADLAALDHRLPPEHAGTFAIAGATLVDATGAPPIEDSVVIVRGGRIAAVGPRGKVGIPRGMTVLNAQGQTLLPGLWEMHTHFSGVEFGPALLAAGITTARDCGGEFDYLVAQRDAIEKRNALGPRPLLAGLVDAGGAKAFGQVTAETPEEARAVVSRYHANGFQQIKLYTYLNPEIVRIIAAEAHRLGMTVTGHVPQALNTFEGIDSGMDQINHLSYVRNMMLMPGAERVDITSEAVKKAIQFLKDHHTVVDPTIGWGEMASHSKEVDPASFEPGLAKAPFVLDVKFRSMGAKTTAGQMHSRMQESLTIIRALHTAGVTIVPGSDTGLVGFGLHRELELYVEAGMTPLEAIQSATIVSARAMNLDRDSGTIEAGKRADMILVDGNPLANIADLRRVSRVIANGRVYDTAKLWQSVGFR